MEIIENLNIIDPEDYIDLLNQNISENNSFLIENEINSLIYKLKILELEKKRQLSLNVLESILETLDRINDQKRFDIFFNKYEKMLNKTN